MKIYIATPVNGRSEATLEEKREAAYKRVKELEYTISKCINGAEFAEFHSAFDADIAPFGSGISSEPKIMGKCVQRVMECDMIVMDFEWERSKGCQVELKVADLYGKELRQMLYRFNGSDFVPEISEIVRVRKKGFKY